MSACHVVTSMAVAGPAPVVYLGNWMNHIQQDLPTNLWLMDEGAGATMVDWAGNQNGTIITPTITNVGELGGTYCYTTVSNVSGIATAPTAVRPAFGEKFSIEFSVYNNFMVNGLYAIPICTLPSGNPALGSGLQISCTGGIISFGIYQSLTAYASATCADISGAIWHHWVFTYDGAGTWKAYHNGVSQTVTPSNVGTVTGLDYSANAPLRLGGSGGAPIGYGNMMDFMAYWAGVELSQVQVTAHFVSYVNDSSALRNHGAPTSNITYGNAGKDGSCFTVTAATSPLFTIPAGVFEPAYNEPWSISFWWYGVLTDDCAFLGSRDLGTYKHGVGFVTSAIGKIYLGMYGDTAAANYAYGWSVYPGLTAGAWHHIVGTYDGSGSASGFKIYLDTNAQPMNLSAQSITSTPAYHNALYVGSEGPNITGYLPAGSKMDMLSLWKGTALSAGQAAAIYANPTSAYILANLSANLKALYAMDQTA